MSARILSRAVMAAALAAALACAVARAGENLVPDPSFEEPRADGRNRWGHVFEKWGGNLYEGEAEFRVSDIARTGKHSLLIFGGTGPKIRAWPNQFVLEPGRYRVTAYLRGLDIGTGVWNSTTELQFAGKYIPLKKNGTFGWTKLTHVADVPEKKEYYHPSFGLWASGYFWVDDVSVEKVADDVPVTAEPTLDAEEAPIKAPGELTAEAVACPECGYKNMPAWGKCYACGSALEAKAKVAAGEPVKLITSFEDNNPFAGEGGSVVAEHATDGAKALKMTKSYVSNDTPQSWVGYDYIKADCYTDAAEPLELYFEVRDKATRDYWTRVNYQTIVPPGASTLIIPTALYVGEKSRPGRPLDLANITRTVFSVGDAPKAALFIDNVRLERDTEVAKVLFDGLWAFDLGLSTSPVMEGFKPLTTDKRYTPNRGWGLKDCKTWRVFDALQPDPLYEDFICIEKGGLALDVPNGKYHVFVNMDSPSGYWGEYQTYRERSLIVEGQEQKDTMDLEAFKKRYYRFWATEDLPTENTFEKFQEPYFDEKELDVEVTDGQLNIDFSGENWGCCVSAIIAYPLEKKAEGERFLKFVKDRRRFHFDNYFKRTLRPPRGEVADATPAEKARGFVVFGRDYMSEVYYYDLPKPGERDAKLAAAAFAGEYEPVTVAVVPLKDLGELSASVTDLASGKDKIPASAVDVGYVQYRVSRVTMEGSVYNIQPRIVIPLSSVAAPKEITRRFWLTVKVHADAKPGLYKGEVKLASKLGGTASVPLEVRVLKGSLDEVDIPAGPWGYEIGLPWHGEPAVAQWDKDMATKSLKKLRECGFTTSSGLPVVSYGGFKDGKPQLNFTRGDEQMDLFKSLGFKMPVVTYCAFGGLNLYYKDDAAMKAAGFTDYSEFVKAVWTEIQKHSDEKGWLPVYWNLGDEPIGDNLTKSAENAEAYRKAFPKGPPFFTAASSYGGSDRNDPHFRLGRALHAADWNIHSEDSVNLLHEMGSDWAFYNGGNRWTYGVYMYKAAKQFNMKFRVSWHWNVVAGDPYYALDCREDDYAWCNSSPDGALIPAVHFEELREGLDDYRRMLTLARLAKENAGKPAAQDAEKILADILGAFKLGQRDLTGAASFGEIRSKLDAAIEKLR